MNKQTQHAQPPAEDLSPARPRDPEDRQVPEGDASKGREKGLDKTLADSFPTSDPPSSIPNPEEQS